jgi:hypothetical protein
MPNLPFQGYLVGEEALHDILGKQPTDPELPSDPGIADNQ